MWGFGRAGQRFSELMDAEVGASGQRPMMVGCCDTERTTIDQRGLSHERMAAFKARNGKVPAARGTVLGPGYNRDHADHFHLDLKDRRNVACH